MKNFSLFLSPLLPSFMCLLAHPEGGRQERGTDDQSLSNKLSPMCGEPCLGLFSSPIQPIHPNNWDVVDILF